MARKSSVQKRDEILRAVIEILESEGYDGVKLRDVANRTRTSLATIYRHFRSRERLMIAALTRWMEENPYSSLDEPAPDTVHAGLRWVHARIFEPWKSHPRILEAYHRAVVSEGGTSLEVLGMMSVEPVSWRYIAHLEPSHAEDVAIILSHLIASLIGRAARGEITVDEVLDVVDRAVVRLVDDGPVTPSNDAALANRDRVLRSLVRSGADKKRS